MSSNPCIYMAYRGGELNWMANHAGLCAAVWLHTKVRDCGFGLQPRPFAGHVPDDRAA